MINIAICDDESRELDRAIGLIKKYTNEHPQHHLATYSFATPLELLEYALSKGGFDVLLLDVYMPGILGTEAARELRDMGDKCQIIFMTTSRDHAIDAFSVDAANYLVKPYTEKEFFLALEKVMDKLTKKDEDYITVKSVDGTIRIELNKLVYSETQNHIQKLYMLDGRVVNVRKSSTELFELLAEDPRFYKCGSTYIINMDYVIEISSMSVAFSTGAKIPVLSRKRTEFKKLYMDYICSR